MTRNSDNTARGIICVAAAIILMAGCGSLSKSAINGSVEGVKKYMAKGESVNAVDGWGWTPLMWAAYYNYYDVAKFLLENGANVNARTQKSYRAIDEKSTALIVASYYGFDGMVRLLLSHGADKSIENARGMTAMDIATHYSMTAVLERQSRSRTNPPLTRRRPRPSYSRTGAGSWAGSCRRRGRP
jgi:hypothetical protein